MRSGDRTKKAWACGVHTVKSAATTVIDAATARTRTRNWRERFTSTAFDLAIQLINGQWNCPSVFAGTSQNQLPVDRLRME
jgi:hypothetical protein